MGEESDGEGLHLQLASSTPAPLRLSPFAFVKVAPIKAALMSHSTLAMTLFINNPILFIVTVVTHVFLFISFGDEHSQKG